MNRKLVGPKQVVHRFVEIFESGNGDDLDEGIAGDEDIVPGSEIRVLH